MSQESKLWLGFTVSGVSGAALTPQKIQFWKNEDFKKHPPEEPFHYRTDALVGLAAIHLNQHLKGPFSSPNMNFSFCTEAWRALEPHHELFEKSQARVSSLRKQLKTFPPKELAAFERNFTDVLNSSFENSGLDLQEMTQLIDVIDSLESSMERPLVYNFSLQLSKTLIEKFHYLHSLLFNLRALVAMDHNAFINDPAHEALKIDSITDYLPRADYVSNDALLYFHFKKQAGKIPETAFAEIQESFWRYSHNGACLIENLPKSFLNSMSVDDLGEGLFIAQMDWLLGTDAGLLFRIREELFGLREGYDKIFWTDLESQKKKSPQQLSVSCELTESQVFPKFEAA